MKQVIKNLGSIVFLSLAVIGCNENPSTDEEHINKVELSKNPLGVGPIQKLELSTISDSTMRIGMELFKNKCATCHTMEFKNSGPDISDLLSIRKPEWIVNFLINREEMLTIDSLAIKTRKLYEEDCEADLSEKEALDMLEYLRMYRIWLHEFNAF